MLKYKAVLHGILVLLLCLSPVTLPSSSIGRNEPCFEGVLSRLYFGQSTPDGAVTETQWRAFIAESVTPRFPDGFTELQAHGHWRDARGTAIDEDTRIVEIVHDDASLNQQRVRAIAADYKRRFAQQSVLITQAQS
ncbi:MAG: DUF3574 domain-containing protein, partial [Burkholderiaceae bacterium]